MPRVRRVCRGRGGYWRRRVADGRVCTRRNALDAHVETNLIDQRLTEHLGVIARAEGLGEPCRRDAKDQTLAVVVDDLGVLGDEGPGHPPHREDSPQDFGPHPPDGRHIQVSWRSGADRWSCVGFRLCRWSRRGHWRIAGRPVRRALLRLPLLPALRLRLRLLLGVAAIRMVRRLVRHLLGGLRRWFLQSVLGCLGCRLR